MCDRCGFEIKGKPTRIFFKGFEISGNGQEVYTDVLQEQNEKCYCKKCVGEIIDHIYAGPDLDRGKIQALQTAGWSMKDIAVEMAATEDVIRYNLKEIAKEKANKPTWLQMDAEYRREQNKKVRGQRQKEKRLSS